MIISIQHSSLETLKRESNIIIFSPKYEVKNVKASASETSRNCEAISVIEAIVYWNALSAIIDYGNIYMSSLLFTISDTLTNNWTVNKNETLKISQTWYIFLIFRLPLDWVYFLLKTGADIKALSKTNILRCICALISSQRILFSFCLRPAEEIRGAAYDNSEATAYYVKSLQITGYSTPICFQLNSSQNQQCSKVDLKTHIIILPRLSYCWTSIAIQ